MPKKKEPKKRGPKKNEVTVDVKVRVNWKSFIRKFLSRKFLTTLGTEVALLVTALGYENGDRVAEIILRAGTVLGMVLTAVVYVFNEASVDRAALKQSELETQIKRDVRP